MTCLWRSQSKQQAHGTCVCHRGKAPMTQVEPGRDCRPEHHSWAAVERWLVQESKVGLSLLRNYLSFRVGKNHVRLCWEVMEPLL